MVLLLIIAGQTGVILAILGSSHGAGATHTAAGSLGMLRIPVPGLRLLLLCHLMGLPLVLLRQATSLMVHCMMVVIEVTGQGHTRRNVVIIVTIQFVGTTWRWRMRGI